MRQTPVLTEVKTSAIEVCWKCFSEASPSHKPQQLSSTARGMCRKGSSLTAAEVRSTLRSGWQHQHESADSYSQRKNKQIQKNLNIICKDNKFTHRLPFNKAVHCLSTHHPDMFGFTIWNLSKLGQPNCLSVGSIYLSRLLGRGPNLDPTHCNRGAYLVMLCIRRELHKGLKCASLCQHELDVWSFFM